MKKMILAAMILFAVSAGSVPSFGAGGIPIPGRCGPCTPKCC